MTHPELALVVVTYQRPRHLQLVLESILAQQPLPSIELVVSDDGSTDQTRDVVTAFAKRAPFSVKFVTHPHQTFQAARCRNAGAAATTAPYLLFLDGDCVLPRDHLAAHLARRSRGVALVGDVCRLDKQVSGQLNLEQVQHGEFAKLITESERRRLRKTDRKFRLYNFFRHPTKPYKLRSGNFSIWREDYERVNGFDENFCGWGGEDDDLGRRLRRAGVRLESIVRWTHAYHVWHPRETTAPVKVKTAANTQYLWRKNVPIRCENGLFKH